MSSETPYSVIVAVGLIVAGLVLVALPKQHPPYPDITRVSHGWFTRWTNWEPWAMLQLQQYEKEGYAKYNKKGLPFMVKLFGVEAIILPTKYLQPMKLFDRHALNFAQLINDNMQMEATVGDTATANDMEIELVSRHLNLKMKSVIALLADEAEFQIQSQLGSIPDYRTMPTYSLCEHLVHHISSRALVGEKLCRDPAYMAACRKYTMLHFISGIMWNFLPLGALRKPFYRLASFKFRWDMNKATGYIVPEIQARMKAAKSTKTEKPVDVIQFAVDQRIPAPREHDATRHAKRIIHLSFAGTGTSISLLYNLIYSILCHPLLVPQIRNEIDNAFSRFGKDSWNDKRMLQSLHILDSVIRETLRLYPAACFSAQRTAIEKLRFHDGFELQPRSRVAFATVSTNTDPENYVDPETFDGLRFVGTAESERSTGKTAAVTVNDKFLSWGHGSQACPGRFYAVQMIKIVFGKLIYKYDLEWASEERKRPVPMVIEGTFMPDMKAQVRIKSRNFAR